MHCTGGESGEFVGKITRDISRQFDGYLNKDATNKKIIRNVFSQGDQAFLSGDLLTMDEHGYLYFKDRTGDTFRWKGENVSTAEVESVISNILDQRDSVVFGVEIKDCEGRAGMAAIEGKEGSVDLDKLLERMMEVLPKYSIPVFIRLCSDFEVTGELFDGLPQFQRSISVLTFNPALPSSFRQKEPLKCRKTGCRRRATISRTSRTLCISWTCERGSTCELTNASTRTS